MKSKRQQFIEATKAPHLDVVVNDSGDQVTHRVMLVCPGCGVRYYRDIAPPFCLVPRCEFDFTRTAATVVAEQDLTHATKQAVSRYVLV